MVRRSSALLNQGNLFGKEAAPAPESALPDIFAYRDGVITPEEERALVERFEALPFKPFEFHGFLGKRRVISFGWRYDFAGRALRDSDPIPSFLLPLRQQAADFAGVPAESLEQILINEYGSRCWRRVCCGSGGSVAPNGSEPPATSTRDPPIFCGGRYGENGNIVSHQSRNCATR
jgi:hypothetical protein